MKYLILLSTILFVTSCIEKEETKMIFKSFKLHGTSTLTIQNHSSDSAKIEISSYSRIPGAEQAFDTIIYANDSTNYELKTQGYCYYALVVNDVYYRVFSSHGSEVRAEIISDSSVLFSNDFDSINNYLAISSGSYYSTNEELMDLINLTGNAGLSYDELMRKNDEIIRKYQKQLVKNKNFLPDWYVELENKRLSILGASFKLNSLSYRKRMLRIEDEIPPHYVDTIVKGLSFLDERLMGFATFKNFLNDYRSQSFNPLNDTMANRFNEDYNDSLIAHTALFIPKPFSDYALFDYLSFNIERNLFNFNPEWIELVSDTVFKNFLYVELKAGEVLPKGVKAPYFSALQWDSSTFNSSELKDTLILINFWASYCKPCIQNFAYENALVEQFKNEPVKVINFCIETEFSTFQHFIEMHHLKTMNLFANEKMTAQIKKDFDIHGLPHSILIDKEGEVLKNKCSVNKGEIAKDIEKYILK